MEIPTPTTLRNLQMALPKLPAPAKVGLATYNRDAEHKREGTSTTLWDAYTLRVQTRPNSTHSLRPNYLWSLSQQFDRLSTQGQRTLGRLDDNHSGIQINRLCRCLSPRHLVQERCQTQKRLVSSAIHLDRNRVPCIAIGFGVVVLRCRCLLCYFPSRWKQMKD